MYFSPDFDFIDEIFESDWRSLLIEVDLRSRYLFLTNYLY